jgi:hypothetical protein
VFCRILYFSNFLSLSLLVYHKDLHHPDKDIQEVKLEADALIDCVFAHQATFRHSSVHEHLLDIIEGEATKDRQATVQPDVFCECECSDGGGWENEGSEAGHCHDGDASEKRSAKVEVLFLFGGCAHKRNGAHHGECVEPSSSDDGRWCHEHERCDEGCLGDVEGSPEAILLNVAIKCERKLKEELTVCTYLLGSVALVPIIVPKLRARPAPITIHGFVAMIL